MMRILMPQSIFYVPTLGGENKANRAWLEQMARQGHQCRVVAPACGPQGPAGDEAHVRELARLGVRPQVPAPFVATYRLGGVEVHALARRTLVPGYVARQIHEFDPTWVLVSSLDPGQLLLDTCMKTAPSRVVYLAHTPQHFPFGTDSLSLNPVATGLLQHVRAIVALGRQTALYIRHYTGREPLILQPPVYGSGPFPCRNNARDGYITLINPAPIKGISIFAGLAREFPNWKFGALAGWATTAADRQRLAQIPNVTIWDTVEDIQEVLAQTRILLVPSLYREGFGLVVMEAMLRGIPVLASDYAGLIDAKLGVDYLLPVRPIAGYTPQFDDRGFPLPLVPDQDIGPWAAALRELCAAPQRYAQLAQRSRRAALQFLAAVENDSLGDVLNHLAADRDSAVGPADRSENDGVARAGQLGQCVNGISSQRRALVALRLRGAPAPQGVRP